MNHRSERIAEALRETAAEFLSREAGRQSLITVTGARVSDTGVRADILLSVLPDEEAEGALSFANRHRAEFMQYFKTRVKGVQSLHIEFMLDRGEKNRQRLDELGG